MQLRLTFLRDPALLLGALVSALVILCGSASAGAPEYPSPLYLGGAASSVVGTSNTLVASKGVSANAVGTPTWGLNWGVVSPQIALNGAGALGSPSAISYTYRYTLVDAGGETAPSVGSNTVTASAQQITVSGLPTGVTVRLYRQNGSGAFKQVVELTNNPSSTYNDNIPDASLVVPLPQAQTRTNLSGAGSATGWYDFQPGNAVPNPNVTNGNFPNSPLPAASPVFTGKGWIVDGAGSVAFPAGSWAFTTKIVTTGTSGTSRLVIGMWKVDGAGNVVGSPLIDPACSNALSCPSSAPGENVAGANISLASQTGSAIVSSFSLSTFSLAAGEHLYVQFFRHQTVAAAFGSTISTLNAYDNVAQITHQAASTLPNDPTLQTPLDVAQTNSSALAATFSDPDAGDTGTLSFRVCSAAAAAGSQCLPLVTSGSSPTVANGANGSWTAGPLADGTYYWQALATDATGGQSGWTATQSFTLDTAPPDTTIGTSPVNPNNSTSATFSFTATEAGSSLGCQLDGGGFSACVSPKSYNALADGSHTFQVKATDPAGNTDASPAASTWTVDTVAPATTITASPANQTNATSASFSFGASKAGSSFECQLDGSALTSCTSPAVYSGLGAGSHTFQVKATDPVGNTGSASYSWTVDLAPPQTTIAESPSSLTNSTDAGFSFSSNKVGSSFQCQLDADALVPCTSPARYSGLGDGSHTFQVKAIDPAGNTDPTPAVVAWTVDATPPETTITASPSNPTNATSASFSLGSSEDGSSFQCQLDGGDLAPCTAPAVYSGLGEGSHTFSVEAIDPAGNIDASPAFRSWTVDTTPPGLPAFFAGSAGADGLTLSWWPPGGDGPIAQYVVYVNGLSAIRLDGERTTVNVGRFGSDDMRNFAVAAIDAAGNEGPRTLVLAGVPDLVGLRLSEAGAALEARGLVIGKQTLSAPGSGALVVAQRPAAATLAPLQSTVFVTLANASGSHSSAPARAPFTVHIAGARTVSCTKSSRLTLQIHLDRQAKVAVRFLTTGGVPLDSARLVAVHAGSQTLSLRLPTGLSARKSYRVIVTARTGGRIVRAEIKLTIVQAGIRAKASSSTCG